MSHELQGGGLGEGHRGIQLRFTAGSEYIGPWKVVCCRRAGTRVECGLAPREGVITVQKSMRKVARRPRELDCNGAVWHEEASWHSQPSGTRHDVVVVNTTGLRPRLQVWTLPAAW